MKKLLALFLLISGNIIAQKHLKALIVDGQNNHEQWPKVTMMMKSILESNGRFAVDISRTATTWNGEKFLEKYSPTTLPKTTIEKKPLPDPTYSPQFENYDLVVCNFGWNAAPWPQATQIAFENYIKKGGGLVVIHAADNSWPDWSGYNQMIGIGGWGNRNEKSGPYVYYNKNDKLTFDTTKGPGGSHGAQHEYVIKIRDKKHPITKGMPEEWLHTKDELYDKLRGPAQNMKVLATAYSSPTAPIKGTDRNEPMMMVLKYGKGRIFHTPMGHMDYSVNCVGFMTTLLRGSEWAATGKVKTKIPADFPSKDKASSRIILE